MSKPKTVNFYKPKLYSEQLLILAFGEFILRCRKYPCRCPISLQNLADFTLLFQQQYVITSFKDPAPVFVLFVSLEFFFFFFKMLWYFWWNVWMLNPSIFVGGCHDILLKPQWLCMCTCVYVQCTHILHCAKTYATALTLAQCIALFSQVCKIFDGFLKPAHS